MSRASVTVGDGTVGAIGQGLLVLLGVERGDSDADADYLARKTAGLRIFEDDAGKMNCSVAEMGGQVLVVSQFTLLGDCRKGKRPSFARAADPTLAGALYQQYVNSLQAEGLTVATGVFQAMMRVELVNNGPVTILLDSKKLF